ncbi:hypothetical protein ACFLR2_02105 [Chlamydiota bacterium]
MRKGIIIFLALLPLVGFAEEPVTIKQTILAKQNALRASNEKKKSQIYYELAKAYYEDQEIDQAFCHFLEALKRAATVPPREMCEAEKVCYEPALADYLAQAGIDPEQAAHELLDRYGEIADQHKDYLHLNFLIAMAYANLGKYDAFFERFYRGYPYLSDTFLAHKTKGILYLRLSQRNYCPEERKAFQQEALQCLTRALERNPHDANLYKILVFLAKDEENEPQIRAYLHKMVENQTPIPRSDICFYVKEAVALGEWGVGQAIIDQARSLYDYSRAVSAAQEYLSLSQKKG